MRLAHIGAREKNILASGICRRRDGEDFYHLPVASRRQTLKIARRRFTQLSTRSSEWAMIYVMIRVEGLARPILADVASVFEALIVKPQAKTVARSSRRIGAPTRDGLWSRSGHRTGTGEPTGASDWPAVPTSRPAPRGAARRSRYIRRGGRAGSRSDHHPLRRHASSVQSRRNSKSAPSMIRWSMRRTASPIR